MTGENIISGVLGTVTNTVTNTVHRLDPTRWQGYSHDELYQMLQSGPGATASALPTQRWTEIAGALGDIDADLRGALNRSAEGWHGEAAALAQQKLGNLANWADNASVNATAMRDATQRQADNIAKARADMPAPTQMPPASPDPTMAPAMQVLTLQGDQEAPDAASAAGEQSAHDVMNTYQLNTESTVESLGNFVAPEQIGRVQEDGHGHGNLHGVLGLTSPSGLIDGLLGVPGLNGNEGNNGHHHHYHGGGGGNTSSSGSGWHGSNNPSPSYNSSGEPTGGGRSPMGGYGPVLPGFGDDREENRRNSPVGRTSTPGPNGPVNNVEFGGSAPGMNGMNGLNSGHGTGAFQGVLGANPSSATPSNATPGAHSFASPGAGAAAAALNPNEMPPPTAAPNGTMTSAAGNPGAIGAAGAQGAGADKLLARRGFDPGMGGTSSSWLAEPEPAMPTSSSVRGGSTRRRDFKAQVRVTEREQVDGEDIDLPKSVIGDGERDR